MEEEFLTREQAIKKLGLSYKISSSDGVTLIEETFGLGDNLLKSIKVLMFKNEHKYNMKKKNGKKNKGKRKDEEGRKSKIIFSTYFFGLKHLYNHTNRACCPRPPINRQLLIFCHPSYLSQTNSVIYRFKCSI